MHQEATSMSVQQGTVAASTSTQTTTTVAAEDTVMVVHQNGGGGGGEGSGDDGGGVGLDVTVSNATTQTPVTMALEEVNLEITDDNDNVDLEVPFTNNAAEGSGGLSSVDMGTNYQISGPATTITTSASDPLDTKDGIEELCPVCGDKVSGYHYGLLTCESCKGFFKRTVQNKKVYTCVAERSCHIDKTQRKRCPFCRFQKCLEVGMKLEAVRADRMRGGRNKFGPMYKRDRARKLQMMRQRQLAAQTLRGGIGDMYQSSQSSSSPFGNIHIKQEIQIPQVSSLTSSPDSSPSPIAVALGQVSSNTLSQAVSNQQPALQIVGVQGTPSMMMADNKLWANSTTTSPHSLSPKTFQFDTVVPPSASVPTSSKMSPLIRDFVEAIDDREWQNSLYGLLQSQTYNQCEVDLFELMCKVLDQNLFSQVDWARNSIFFKDLKVDDQMKLLQHSWSDMLVLDHIHQRMHNNLPDETTLHNGQKFDLLNLGLLGVPTLIDHFNDITAKLQELKFDISDYICIKFLLLLNPDVRGITNRKHVQDGFEQVQQALLEYTVTCYSNIQDKFNKMLQILPELHSLAARGEEHLYLKHCNGSAPTQTLLMEMLHAKRK
ncbi:PREDICTED: nuclear hormone receptor FTZ-F1 [Nicrophorus vespilloides]|uniref:Nuclear hormone receptor FTZ-F1 n=1 Tax=Nicrophorus vespilloides TaxID=110193 RepID=A0ABM1MK48_NICVS|nr:PREDICTED: nuclear hormone receptor FTZ-F1 [Nicrophorus vespilloides]